MSNEADVAAPLVERASRSLGGYIQSGRTRGDLLKETAEALVDLRYLFTLSDGRRDLGGRSKEYRDAVSQIYRRAHVPTDRYDTVQAALRYHVGNLLRERASADDLAAVGLTNTSPKARLARTRDVVAAMSKSGNVAELVGDPLRLLTYAEALIEHVDPERLRDLSSREAVAAKMALDEIEARLKTLRPAIAGRRGRRG